jgi:hypothetical protein
MLVNILIIFFLILISYQIILGNNIIEGLDNNNSYQQYNSQDPLILAQQNAGNIEYLKGRIDDVQGMYKQVQDLSGNVIALQEQVNGLVTAQQDYATQMTGGAAPEISGATTPEDGEPQDTSNLVT